MNRVYEYFTSPVFRGYNYLTGMKICRPGAFGEVVFGAYAPKTAIFEEIMTNWVTRKKGGLDLPFRKDNF